MKQLRDFLFESRENKINEFQAFEWIYKILKEAKLTKDQLKTGLSWLCDDLKTFQSFENYINNTDKNAWIYLASKDEFLDKEKTEDILDRLISYFVEKL